MKTTLFICSIFIIALYSLSPTNNEEVLIVQYGKEYVLNLEKGVNYLVLFKAHKEIGTEGVKWTRALKNTLHDSVNLFPVLEFKNSYKLLPKFIKKHIATNNLQGEFHNPGINDKKNMREASRINFRLG